MNPTDSSDSIIDEVEEFAGGVKYFKPRPNRDTGIRSKATISGPRKSSRDLAAFNIADMMMIFMLSRFSTSPRAAGGIPEAYPYHRAFMCFINYGSVDTFQRGIMHQTLGEEAIRAIREESPLGIEHLFNVRHERGNRPRCHTEYTWPKKTPSSTTINNY